MRAVLLVFLIFLPLAQARAQSSNVVIGSCNQINQNVTVAEQATLIIENNCVPPNPEDSFTVSFYWLDSLSLSFLMAGYTDDSMYGILSAHPIVIKNAVYQEITQILSRFGERPVGSDPGFTRFPLYSSRFVGRDDLGDNQRNLLDIPPAALENLRVYDGEARIIWPDVSAFDTFYNTNQWPVGYGMSYPSDTSVSALDLSKTWKNRPNATARLILECTAIHKLVQKEEFEAYWPTIDRLVDRIKASDSSKGLYVFDSIDDPKFTEPGTRSNLNSYEAVKYFTRDGWPSDFLVVRGQLRTEECGLSAAFDLSAIPRDFLALVAVVKPKTSRLRLQGILYKEDQETKLRPQSNATLDLLDDSEYPLIDRTQSFVIPLRTEFRYDMDQLTDIVNDADPNDLYPKIRAIGAEEIRIDPETYFNNDLLTGSASDGDSTEVERIPVNLPEIKKQISAFTEPKTRAITQTYVYGKALDLAGLKVQGGMLNIRKTPRYALLSEGGFEGASCPFLYYRAKDGQLSLKGRVLVGADNESKSRTEEIEVPEGALSIVLMEKEPEITFLSSVEYRDGGGAEWTSLISRFEIEPGQTVELRFARPARKGAALRLSGFYRTLNSYLNTGLVP
ncbi:hypothetical protein [Rhizobium leguminosarum]|uniref:hypothetical protein n=1 Tax=Rhizobium leguminosarum TaxID=384 RepID=UPI001C94C087|nr:hypothetical protein [Rhizobium leguminosarum]MBY5798987.1 hypothetical protein [Rhizobium leguminosarum]